MTDPALMAAQVDGEPVAGPLTRDEDDELRRLSYLAEVGMLSEAKRERILELRLRDRREEIRPPREFAPEAPAAKSTGRRRFRPTS